MADSDRDPFEFDPDYLREMARRSNFLYPGSMVVDLALIPLQCEPARKDLNLKDLSETKVRDKTLSKYDEIHHK